MSLILKSWDTVLESFYFNDANVPFDLYVKKCEILGDDLLAIRLDSQSLCLIKHDNYLSADRYWCVESVDISHCNIELRLPNPTEDFKYYIRVRNKLIKRVETILKKHYTAKNLIDSQGA